MASGKVKWFDNKRGFGFIAQNQGKDVFVHHSAILGRGYKTLAQGEWVTFDMIDSGKGPKAMKVQRLRANHERRGPGRPPSDPNRGRAYPQPPAA